MSQLLGLSSYMEDPLPIGPPSEDLDALLGLADLMATNRPDLIVYVEGPALQKWVSA